MKILRHFILMVILASFACHVERPKLKGYVIVQEHGVEVFNEDEFDFTECHVGVGPYQGKRSDIIVKSHSSIRVSWSELYVPWWKLGVPPVQNASVGWLNPQVLECVQGRREGFIE